MTSYDPQLSKERPFPGLAAFKEVDTPFFHGRRTAIDQLLEMIERQTLVVLYATSGLGKTSLLHAGVFPELKKVDRFPVSIRLDFNTTKTDPHFVISQVKAAAAQNGVDLQRIRVQQANGAEALESTSEQAEATLWGFFRHTAFFSKKNNRLLEPVLVFDQFEELFTRANEDARAALELVDDVADAVEQIVPDRLQQLVQEGKLSAYHRDRGPVKCVIALREDFLADLDALKPRFPLLDSRRYRLGRLTRADATTAICKPSPGLISEEVAGRVVDGLVKEVRRNLSITREDAVEPALLSLFCERLNDARLRSNSTKIDALLVNQAAGQILKNFYAEATRDLGSRTQHFLETSLISSLGYRTSAPQSNALKAGAKQAELDRLVKRRLLRIEGRFGEPHYELIHDVLVSEVRDSRQARRSKHLVFGLITLIVCAIGAGALIFERLIVPSSERRAGLDQRAKALDQLQAGSNLEKLQNIRDCRQQANKLLVDEKSERAGDAVANCNRAAETLAKKLDERARLAHEAKNPERALMLLAEAARVRGVAVTDTEARRLVDDRLQRTIRPDGQLVVGVGVGGGRSPMVYGLAQGGVRVWNGASGQLLGVLRLPPSEDADYVPGSAFAPTRLVVQGNERADSILALFGRGDYDPARNNRQTQILRWRLDAKVVEGRGESAKPLEPQPVFAETVHRLVRDVAFVDRTVIAVQDLGLATLAGDANSLPKSIGEDDGAFLRVAVSAEGEVAVGGRLRSAAGMSVGVATLTKNDKLRMNLAPAAITAGAPRDLTVSAMTWRNERLIVGLSDGRAFVAEGWENLDLAKGVGRIETIDLCDGQAPLLLTRTPSALLLPFGGGSTEDKAPTPFEGPGAVVSAVLSADCAQVISVWRDGNIRLFSKATPLNWEDPEVLVESLRQRLGYTIIVDDLTLVPQN